MYPPRKQDLRSKSRNNSQSGYVSPAKDHSKFNRIIENAKKHEQAKDTKRDYML